MANAVNKLSARKVQTITTPGRHADGGGLYLVVDPKGAKRWVLLYRLPGRRREMGLGSLLAVPLVKARELAAEARALIAGGVDPLELKHATPPAPEPTPPPPVTFADVAEAYMEARRKTWRNEAHRGQWRQTLQVQAKALWKMPVAQIETGHVLAVLRPMWDAKTETATRIRGRVERVLDAARVGGHRTGENPARWRGHLDVLLPRPGKLKRGHHPAMPYKALPAFYAALCGRHGYSATGMRLVILTAARSGEVRGMVWGEVDMSSALWTVPASRMKAKREHRVPLSAPALAILAELRPAEPDPRTLIFPSTKGTVMSDMAFGMRLRKMGQGDFTTHGFRSSFRDWVDIETDFPGELAEAALAHLVGDETERAYRRGDALEKRRVLMDHWGAFVTTPVPATNASSAS